MYSTPCRRNDERTLQVEAFNRQLQHSFLLALSGVK